LITIKLDGRKDCEEALNELTNATARNVLRRALMAAGEPVKATAQDLAPVMTGQTKEGLVISTQLSRRQRKSNPKQSAVEVYVGVSGRRASFAHLAEFGTSHSAPQAFMRPAADANTSNVIRIFLEHLKAETDKALARARRKAAKLLKGA
jgi:HK97 gp10 family phage protein